MCIICTCLRLFINTFSGVRTYLCLLAYLHSQSSVPPFHSRMLATSPRVLLKAPQSSGCCSAPSFVRCCPVLPLLVGRPTAHERARARATSDTVPLGYRGGGATAHGGARARAPLGTILLSHRAGGAPTSFTSPAHGAPPSAPLR